MDAQGSYIHNDRRSKGHSNKDIDPTRTHLNFWCKKNELTYIKEFDKMKKEERKEREFLVDTQIIARGSTQRSGFGRKEEER